jgi:hypothetical protein
MKKIFILIIFTLQDVPDAMLNFFTSYAYSFAQLDDRLQSVLDFSNVDYRIGEKRFKIATDFNIYNVR